MHIGKAPTVRYLADVKNVDPSNGHGLVYSSALGLWVPTDVATQAELDAHTALTASAHGGILASSAGAVSAASLASGAAASNVGTLGGVLGGTLPSPTMAASAAATNVGTLAGALAGTLPNPTIAPAEEYGSFDFNWIFTAGTPYAINSLTPAANTEYAVRLVCHKAGTVSDLSILIGATSSGNIDAAIHSYDGTTYTKQWSKGSTACPAANTWTSLGNPAYAVTKGQIIYIGFAADNVTMQVARSPVLGATGWGLMSSGMTYPRMMWSKATAFPIVSQADSGVSTGQNCAMIGVKIT